MYVDSCVIGTWVCHGKWVPILWGIAVNCHPFCSSLPKKFGNLGFAADSDLRKSFTRAISYSDMSRRISVSSSLVS